jgi:hypothetical protein
MCDMVQPIIQLHDLITKKAYSIWERVQSLGIIVITVIECNATYWT